MKGRRDGWVKSGKKPLKRRLPRLGIKPKKRVPGPSAGVTQNAPTIIPLGRKGGLTGAGKRVRDVKR
jgi:hypothetical protein